MANILLTNSCNLQCPYCFAQGIKKDDEKKELTPDNFHRLIEFIFKDDSNAEGKIGVLGGEPTISPNFRYYMESLISDIRVKTILVMTNGIHIDKYMDILTNKKVSVLLNINKEEIIGKILYKKTLDNLDILCKTGDINNVYLGCNFWDYKGDNSYIIDLCKLHGFKDFRFTLLSPDFSKNKNALEYYRERKPYVMRFFMLCLANGIIPSVDCSWMPHCVFTEKDVSLLKKMSYNKERVTFELGGVVGCGFPVDLFPDMTASRCFGTSKIVKSISEYANFDSLCSSFSKDIDEKCAATPYSDECLFCEYYETKTCIGPCLGFKMEKILS